MDGTTWNNRYRNNPLLAALGLAAALVIAGCGSGDGSSTPTGDTAPAGDTATTGDTTPSGDTQTTEGAYPVWSFSFPLLAKGSLDVAGLKQEYPLTPVSDLKACTIANLGGIEKIDDNTLATIAAVSTVAGGFAVTADLSAGDNFSFWRLGGGGGTENWSSYFSVPDERWSGSGQQAKVEAKFFEFGSVDSDGKVTSLPVLGIRVRWAGKAIENLSSREEGASVEFECYFSPTSDWLFKNEPKLDVNGDGILDEYEAEGLRGAIYYGRQKLSW